MATNNFENHANGIFLLGEYDREEAIESLKNNSYDDGYESEDFSDDEIQEEILFYSNLFAEEFLSNFVYNVEELKMGYEVRLSNHSRYEGKVFNKKGLLVAEIKVQSGYYTGWQVIVETDPNELFCDEYFETQAELLQEYTPHHKRLLKLISMYTNKIEKVGGFSNGEAVYEYAK